MKQTEIKKSLEQYGSYEFNKSQLDEVKEYKLSTVYLDSNTCILYSLETLQLLFEEMVYTYDDFLDEYPNLDSFTKYFTKMN